MAAVSNTRQLMAVLVFLPFFFSMLITNDVSLITFVPFGIVVLRMSGRERLVVPMVVLQTLAANLGSILTPIGNPQNLYLYAKSGMHPGEFLKLMLPYTLVSGICLLLVILFIKKENVEYTPEKTEEGAKFHKIYPVCYSLMFLLCLLSVAKQLKPLYLLGIVCLFLLLADRDIFRKIDYALLGTFIGFFIFVGNIGRVEAFRQVLERMLEGREMFVSAACSQIISNVPAALLLSGFTEQWESLIVGTNLGGLGTLIASMASLISYKQIVREYPALRGKYLLYFTAGNLLLMGILSVLYLAIS